MKNVLIIGGTGFVGGHLKNIFNAEAGKYYVYVTGRAIDVRDILGIQSVISSTKPDIVIYLAAITTLKESIERPDETYQINFLGVLNVLKALKAHNFLGSFLFVSSSEVYGSIDLVDLPVKENAPLNPSTPYALSKLAAEFLCMKWALSEDFSINIARPFNHIGPCQSDRFAISNFAKQISKVKLGLAPPLLEVGEIETSRDFSDVRDVATAYGLIVESNVSGHIFNICSGRSRTIRSLIDRMCVLNDIALDIKVDRSRIRAFDQRIVYGDNSKLTQLLNWSPKFAMDSTLTAITGYWDGILGSQNA
jgi:GDP-4-dehydro-6-deoxy-D-mannose reductase